MRALINVIVLALASTAYGLPRNTGPVRGNSPVTAAPGSAATPGTNPALYAFWVPFFIVALWYWTMKPGVTGNVVVLGGMAITTVFSGATAFWGTGWLVEWLPIFRDIARYTTASWKWWLVATLWMFLAYRAKNTKVLWPWIGWAVLVAAWFF